MKTSSRCILLGILVLGGAAGACNGSDGQGTATGGSQSTSKGGTSTTTQSQGGTQASSSSSQGQGGTSVASGGTQSTGGTTANGSSSVVTGGSNSGGTASTSAGGNANGGSVAAGGKPTGGTSSSNGGSVAAAGKSSGGNTPGGASNGGSVASGGKATGGAATGGAATGGATATPCSFPSSFTTPGSPTYTTYDLPNPITACGYNGSNNQIKNIVNAGYFAAIPGNTSQDFNTNNRCGACVQIGSAIITIVDECPNDSNAPCKANPSGHLDLAKAAASAAGVQGDPNKKGQAAWKYVPCPVKGNVIVRLKDKNDNEIFIENEIMPIASVTCGSQTGSRTFYGAWHFSANVNGQSCSATDVANRSVTFTVGTTQNQDVDTGVQFPKCN